MPRRISARSRRDLGRYLGRYLGRICAQVQLYASVALNSLAYAPCCDRYTEAAGTIGPACAEFGVDGGRDASVSQPACPLYLEFPASGLDDHGRFHPTCYVADWSDVQQVRRCRINGSPDLRTSDDAVRDVLRAHLNQLVGRGVSGFRILDALAIGATDFGEIWAGVGPIRDDIAEAVGLPRVDGAAPQPAVIYDSWPEVALLRDPSLQPSDPLDLVADLTPRSLLDLGIPSSYATDVGFAFAAGDAWLACAGSDGSDLGNASRSTERRCIGLLELTKMVRPRRAVLTHSC